MHVFCSYLTRSLFFLRHNTPSLTHGVLMKLFIHTLLIVSAVPLCATGAEERPQFFAEIIPQQTSVVFSTPSYVGHVVGIPPTRSVPDATSQPDVVAVESLQLPPSTSIDTANTSISDQMLDAFKKYCNQGEDMTDQDWRIVERAGGAIPDSLTSCLPPK